LSFYELSKKSIVYEFSEGDVSPTYTLWMVPFGLIVCDAAVELDAAATPSLTLICERPAAPTPRQLVPILYSHNTHRSKWTTICRSIGRSVVCRSCFMRFDRIKKLDFTKNVLDVNSTGFSESVFVFEP